MQTFLPLSDFAASAAVLDDRRLGNQRNEAWIILCTNTRGHGGWYNHAATRIWRGFDPALRQYLRAICLEWIDRGFTNNVWFPNEREVEMPSWLGDPAFHASHRSNLLRKDPVWYGQFGWTDDPQKEYLWPA